MVGHLSRLKFLNPQKAHPYHPKGCVCAILNKFTHGFVRSIPETKCGQISGTLKIIMADGSPIVWVKLQKFQKAHINHVRDVCV